nr:hypothetical protein [Halomonas tianxiuensis]
MALGVGDLALDAGERPTVLSPLEAAVVWLDARVEQYEVGVLIGTDRPLFADQWQGGAAMQAGQHA